MTVASTRAVSVAFTGDYSAAPPAFQAAANAASPGVLHQVFACTTGFNALVVPAGATGLTVTKPAGNTVTLTWKGVTGDTGTLMGLTDVDSFSLGAGFAGGITVSANVSLFLTWT